MDLNIATTSITEYGTTFVAFSGTQLALFIEVLAGQGADVLVRENKVTRVDLVTFQNALCVKIGRVKLAGCGEFFHASFQTAGAFGNWHNES